MKRVFVACVGLLAVTFTAGPSGAADLRPRDRVQPYGLQNAQPPVYYPWTGFYLGINGGGAWGRSQWDGLDKFAVSGGLIGATIGYNWQFGQFGQLVAGFEGDIGWAGIQGSTNTLCPLGCETRNHWLATARGRVGYAWDRFFLPYVTAGLAVGDIAATTPGWPAGSVTAAGWTVGAGLEFRVVNNVSLKLEYLFVDLADFNCGLNCGLAASGNVSSYANVFRGGLNFRFISQ